jgi:trans-aconitate 2-methyltransferase
MNYIIIKSDNMYKWDPEDYYKSWLPEQQKLAQELILKLAIKGDERVLDIGCGDGTITAEIAKQLPNGSVLGIDNSEEMIHFARKNFSSKRFPNLAFKVKDASDLSFSCEFDIVISNATLHWIIDHLTVLKGIKRSLRPSGKAILLMGGKGNAVEILEVLETIIKSEKWSRYFRNFSFQYGFYGPEEYRDWLEYVGLEVKRVELISIDWLTRKEKLSAWIRTTWLPYPQRVPEGLREEFINEIVDKYIEKYPLDNYDFIHVKMMRLEVEAVSPAISFNII